MAHGTGRSTGEAEHSSGQVSDVSAYRLRTLRIKYVKKRGRPGRQIGPLDASQEQIADFGLWKPRTFRNI